jgi:DNA-binding transcriptional LysR family regulator
LNWDDLKYFLVVCRTGSIRGAATKLNVNHATVSRRVNSFEASLGQRLFERSAKGYKRTALGDEIYIEAYHLEARLNALQRKVVATDQAFSGDIRITLPDVFAQDLLMPCFADFCKLHPNIELEIVDSTKVFNLANREADVALRLCSKPPEYLIGKKLAEIHRACYVSTKVFNSLDLSTSNDQTDLLNNLNWIGWTDKLRRPIGKIASDYPRLNSKHKIISSSLQVAACLNDMGVAILPCFLGDVHPGLVRIPPYTSQAKHDLWILSHPDLKTNAKIAAFVRFITQYIVKNKDLLEGRQLK